MLRNTIEHSAAGLRELVAVLARTGAAEVAIERPDGPVVDALLGAGITVVVISPNQLKNLRSRYGSAGNKDDRFDAFVLADTLRTDRARLRPLVPDSPATAALRATCRARKDLVSHRVAVANQLREHLKRVFPGAVGLFADLDSAISLTFLTRFDCQDRADWLTPKRLGAWLDSVGYPGRTDPGTLHARLTTAPRGATGQEGTTHAHITRALVATLTTLVEQIAVLSKQIGEQLASHTDAHIFTSLPRVWNRPRGPAFGRNRGLPRPIPHPRSTGVPGRRGTVDPSVGKGVLGRLPLGLRQTTTRRGLRLRQRFPPRQPLGRRPLQPRHRPQPRPPPRRTHSRPRLALRHLALLADQHRLQPRQPPSPPGPTQSTTITRGLTQGYSRWAIGGPGSGGTAHEVMTQLISRRPAGRG